MASNHPDCWEPRVLNPNLFSAFHGNLAGFQKFLSVWHTFPIYRQNLNIISSVQSLRCLTLCNPINRSTPGLPVHHPHPWSTQTYVHWVGDAIQPSHPLLSPSPLALNLSQYQGLFQRVSSSYQVAKVVEFQLQHQSFQWTLRTDLL